MTSSLRSTSEASDHAWSWTARSTEDFEQHYIEESKGATQVILRVRIQLTASLLCVTRLCIISNNESVLRQSAACELRWPHPCRLACGPKFVTATTAPAFSALLGVLIQQSSPAKASIASSDSRQAPSYAADPQQSHEQRRAWRPEHSGCHTAENSSKGMQSWSQPASSRSEPAESACPLCGVSVKSTALQAHVAAELDEQDRAASAAPLLAKKVQSMAGHARQHVETSTLQLDTVHVKQQQQQQPFRHVNGVPHAEALCSGAVSNHHSNALCGSSSSAGNCANVAHHWRHQLAHAAFQGPHLSDHAHASSRAALAMRTDENVQGFISSGAAFGYGKARNCPQHQRMRAAGMQSTAQHQAGRSQRSQKQAHTCSTSGRCPLQQQERKLCRKAGVKRNSQVTSSIESRMQT